MELLRGYLPEVNPNHEDLTVDELLQVAFLMTFPKNICLSADEKLEFPFYLMIRDKQLLKVHGSSIISRQSYKPKWVCCQNLVLSSVTKRPMARILVPIKDKLLNKLYKLDHKKALQMEEQKLAQRMIESEVPTAVLRYFRSKNHNEVVQKELVKHNAHMETDEDREQIIYFYLREINNEQGRIDDIKKMMSHMNKIAHDIIFKRHYLFSVSDKTKMQVNEKGDIVDVLTSQQFIQFIIKSHSKDLSNFISEAASILEIPEALYYIQVSKEKGTTSVTVNEKNKAAKLFHYLRTEYCKRRKIPCKRSFM